MEPKSKFFTQEGFYISWRTEKDDFRVFVKSKTSAQILFFKLKKRYSTVELLRIKDGKMKKVA